MTLKFSQNFRGDIYGHFYSNKNFSSQYKKYHGLNFLNRKNANFIMFGIARPKSGTWATKIFFGIIF